MIKHIRQFNRKEEISKLVTQNALTELIKDKLQFALSVSDDIVRISEQLAAALVNAGYVNRDELIQKAGQNILSHQYKQIDYDEECPFGGTYVVADYDIKSELHKLKEV